MRAIAKAFLSDERGATSIEYVVVASLVAVAFIVGATMLGNAVDDMYRDVGTTVTDQMDYHGDLGNGIGRDR